MVLASPTACPRRGRGQAFLGDPHNRKATMTKANPQTGEIVTVGETRPVWAEVQNAPTHADKLAASSRALQLVTLPDLKKPIPMFFVDLPWAGTREEAQDEILSRLIAADDLESATKEDNLVKLETLVGHTINIFRVTAREGSLDEGWGAYLSLDITVDADPNHKVLNTSSKEVCVLTWRAYCEGKLPLRGRVILKGNPTPGRDQPVGLMVESAF